MAQKVQREKSTTKQPTAIVDDDDGKGMTAGPSSVGFLFRI